MWVPILTTSDKAASEGTPVYPVSDKKHYV
jgi:hypothetical protein